MKENQAPLILSTPNIADLDNGSNESNVHTSLLYRKESVSTREVITLLQEVYSEWKKIWYLAAPAIFTNVCQYTIGAVTQMFSGHLGTMQLAAISLENTVISSFGYGILMGMGSALETLCGQAYGANLHHMMGIYLQRSWIILYTAAIAIMPLFFFATPILNFLGQTKDISQVAGNYALWMIPQQFAYALFIPLSKFLQAQSKVMEMAFIAAVALCVHAFLSWFMMLRVGWGLAGGAVALNISWWFMAAAQLVYVVGGCCRGVWSGFSWKALAELSEFIKLSISTAVMFCLEIWYITALVLVAGHLNNAEVSLDALSICMNLTGWSTMVGLGFNVAVSVRVSNELGSGNAKAARFSSMVVAAISFLLGFIFAVALWLFRKEYPALFSDSTEVKLLVEDLTPLLALSVTFSCVQYTISGVAIGAGWQKFVAYLNSGCYFLFGAPIGILMCYKFDMGVKGLWCGMVLGLSLQTCLLFWIICVTNWKQEAEAAQERLRRWGGVAESQDDEAKLSSGETGQNGIQKKNEKSTPKKSNK